MQVVGSAVGGVKTPIGGAGGAAVVLRPAREAGERRDENSARREAQQVAPTLSGAIAPRCCTSCVIRVNGFPSMPSCPRLPLLLPAFAGVGPGEI